MDWHHNRGAFCDMACCVSAVKIADKLKTKDDITNFYNMDCKQQEKLIPGITGYHSGNSFGMACLLAKMYVTKPELIPMYHGAMCGLVGCKEYGCYVAYKKQ